MARRTITSKQRAFSKMISNGNYNNKGEAMIQAGYSESAARHPARVEKQKGFQLALVEEATKVGNIIDAMSARLATEDWQDYTAEQTVDMLKKVSEAQKNILSSLPKQQEKNDPSRWNVIDINPE